MALEKRGKDIVDTSTLLSASSFYNDNKDRAAVTKRTYMRRIKNFETNGISSFEEALTTPSRTKVASITEINQKDKNFFDDFMSKADSTNSSINENDNEDIEDEDLDDDEDEDDEFSYGGRTMKKPIGA